MNKKAYTMLLGPSAVVAALAECWLLLCVPAFAQLPLTDRVVRPLGMEDGSLFVYPGLSPSHFRFIVAMLARSARVPIGFEVVAQEPEKYDGNLARIPVDDRTPLVGLTIGRALNALVAADPRYAWRERDGMLIIRPVEAWRDATNFLNESVGPIDERRRPAIDIVKGLYDQKGLRLIWSSGGVIGNPTQIKSDLHLPISVTVPTSTILDVLNAITKSHGQLGWLIQYAHGPAEFRYSCVHLITFDGRFVGVAPIVCPGY